MSQFIVGGWFLLILLTFLSYGRRTVLQFRRKDEYRFEHRVG
jgi:hypothetical protein